MKSSIAILLAASGVAFAQLNQLPRCAMSCFTQAVGASSCEATNFVCQCTTGRQAVQQALIPCLCQSDCSSEEVTTALAAGEKICAGALASASQSYAAPTSMPSDVCAALGSASMTGTMTGSMTGTMSMPMTGTATATGTARASGTASGTASEASGTAEGTGAQNNEVSATGTETGTSETGTASASLASSTGAASRMGMEGALFGLAGLAVLAL